MCRVLRIFSPGLLHVTLWIVLISWSLELAECSQDGLASGTLIRPKRDDDASEEDEDESSKEEDSSPITTAKKGLVQWMKNSVVKSSADDEESCDDDKDSADTTERPCHPKGCGPMSSNTLPEVKCNDKSYEEALTGSLADKVVDSILTKVKCKPKLMNQVGLCDQSNVQTMHVSHPGSNAEIKESTADGVLVEAMQQIDGAIQRLLESRGPPTDSNCLKPPQELLDFLGWLLTDDPNAPMPAEAEKGIDNFVSRSDTWGGDYEEEMDASYGDDYGSKDDYNLREEDIDYDKAPSQSYRRSRHTMRQKYWRK